MLARAMSRAMMPIVAAGSSVLAPVAVRFVETVSTKVRKALASRPQPHNPPAQPVDPDYANRQRSNAKKLVYEIPPIVVDRDFAVCDGGTSKPSQQAESSRVRFAGGGATGHPVSWIAVNEHSPSTCTYCTLRYIRAKKAAKPAFPDWQANWQDQQ
jgi:hypothetical protein